MVIKPKPNYVLLKIPPVKEKTTKSGLIIPATVTSLDKKYIFGEVMALGDKFTKDRTQRLESDLSLGDKVIIGQYAGTRLHIDDIYYMLVLETEILAVVD